jgi:hypothetical protein
LATTIEDVEAAQAAHKEKFAAYMRAADQYRAAIEAIRQANEDFRDFILNNREDMPAFVVEYIEAWETEQEPREDRLRQAEEANQKAAEAEGEARRKWNTASKEYHASPMLE